MARWLLTFEAIDPRNLEGRWKTGILEKHYRKLTNQGHEKSVTRIVLVDEVLSSGTKCLYCGWSRPDKEDSFVYVGKPAHDFKSLSIETPAPPGMVFLVFVLPDGTVDEWTWRRIAAGNYEPDGVDGELIWRANQN